MEIFSKKIPCMLVGVCVCVGGGRVFVGVWVGGCGGGWWGVGVGLGGLVAVGFLLEGGFYSIIYGNAIL